MRFAQMFMLLLVSMMMFRPIPQVYAQAEPGSPLQVVPQADGVRLVWQGSTMLSPTSQSDISDWPRVQINGLWLPGQIVALRLSDQMPLHPQLSQVQSVPWLAQLPVAELPVPQTSTGDLRPDLATPPSLQPPDSPIVLLHQGHMRGVRIAVLAVSPVFRQDGSLRMATNLELFVPGATPLPEAMPGLWNHTGPFVIDAPSPANPVVMRTLLKVYVDQAGMQRIPRTAIAEVGIDPDTLDWSRLQLWHAGQPVALEQWGSDEVRFYAPAPGDRWNSTDTYWLTSEQGSGVRITNRAVLPGSALLRTTALEQGVWQDNRLYDTTLPGPDGDHWYAADLRNSPPPPPVELDPALDQHVWLPIVMAGDPVSSSSTLVARLSGRLPLVAGTAVLTVTGSAYTSGQHQLEVLVGSTSQVARWEGVGNWEQTYELGNTGDRVALRVLPATTPDGIQPDRIIWQRPVDLDFGGQGAAFSGVAGLWRYALRNTPTERTLYDISDVRTPTRLELPTGTDIQFEDGPVARHYLLAGPGTLHTPSVMAYRPVDLTAPLNADVLYIAPHDLHVALAPLVAHRQAQGYTVSVIDVQAIYDHWSDGQVAPDAIRDFLRYAAATWSRSPQAVTLVGDGTADPHDYFANGDQNVNLIPPYLAMVDPWLGETACETCYAQLDSDILPDGPDADRFPDLALGRFPVKNSTELEALVAKVVAYETSADTSDWRKRQAFVADNYRQADGTVDGAGDFVLFSENSIALQPADRLIQRIYFDPWNRDEQGNPLTDPWRITSAAQARDQVLAALNAGAAIVNYNGHSNHWRWAQTDTNENFLLTLFDADKLTNGARQPVVLAMTCWTSAFHEPNVYGTTLDERLVLRADGGAVAIWGPAGLGVAHGHDALQRGFYQELWHQPAAMKSLGQLTLAGYVELLTNNNCCYDAAQTYVLLGDPLMPLRVAAEQKIYLPFVTR